MAAGLKSWELENTMKLVDPARDALYAYDEPAIKAEANARPWKTDPHHFKSIRISAVALLKMVMHARSGGSYEIMGLMQGYTQGYSIIVTDAFRLPVEGTETRVHAQDEANEYMVNYTTRARESGQIENVVGWYHSHPGYGCWLSGIDVKTQMMQQTYYDPFVAVVIDPDRTISSGKVDIGAFRTYPDNYKPDASAASAGEADSGGFQTIPLAKIEDFGAYSDRYYSLEVEHFKSSLDSKLIEALWNKYWVGTLASSPLFTNRDYGTKQMADLALKIRQAEKTASGKGRNGGTAQMSLGGPGGSDTGGKGSKVRDEQIDKIVKAGNKIAAEEESGLLAGQIKERLFCGVGCRPTEDTVEQE